jgi:hypothetical protein
MAEDGPDERDSRAQKAADFLDTVENLAVPIYAECLTDTTTKVRDGLLLSLLL